MKEKISRGQIYYADLNPVRGSEEGGVRPVLVIQNNTGNKHGPTVIVAPISSQIKKLYMPTHVVIPVTSGIPVASVAMLEQIRTIDKSRLQGYAGTVSDELMDGIDYAIGVSLGIQETDTEPQAEEMELCLCPTCANQFVNSPEHVIRRIDPFEAATDTCAYCEVQEGYHYRIIHKKKRMGDDKHMGCLSSPPAYQPSTVTAKEKDALELTLCPSCADVFYQSRDHYIRRVDPNQTIKEPCMMCKSPNGYDFLILNNQVICADRTLGRKQRGIKTPTFGKTCIDPSKGGQYE